MLRRQRASASTPFNAPGFTTFIPNFLASSCLYASNGGFAGFNERLILPASQLNQGVSGNGFATLTLMLRNSSGTLDGMYIGHQATQTITATNLAFGANTVGTSSCLTASISPGVNKLDIVSVTGSTFAPVPTVTGAGGTWTLIASQFDGGGNRGTHMFRDLTATPGSGPLTLDFGGVSQSFISWSVNEFSGIDISGTHGSGAIVQHAGVGTNSITSTGVTVTLSAFGSTRNVAHGYVRNNSPGAITPGSGFTELSDDLNDEVAEWKVNDTTVDWSWASQTTVTVAIAIEIKAAPVYDFDTNQKQVTFNGATTLPIFGPIIVDSDPIRFNYKPTVPLIVSSHWTGTSITAFSNPSPGFAGASQFLSGASQVSASAPTGSWSSDNNWNFVTSIRGNF